MPVLVANPEPENVALAMVIGALAEPKYVLPPAVADRLTLTAPLVKSPVKDAEFSTPGAGPVMAEASPKVGLVAPIRLYVKVPLVGMLAAGVGIPVT